MCGRCALTLGRCDIVRACAYKRKGDDKYRTPEWNEGETLGRQYGPSPNVAPTDITPVLKRRNQQNENDSDLVVEPMMWGMIPPWHKGNHKSHGLQTNNCRLENVLNSKLYSEPLKQGKRCVVLAEGFYEWQTVDKSKRPYYIYAPQNEGVEMHNPQSLLGTYTERDGWTGVRLLKMAGLYNRWSGDEGPICSYSIITMESNDTLNWLHRRMPAILETDDQVMEWLDVKNVPYQSAISKLKPATKLEHYPVSTTVNNSRNKDGCCNAPLDSNKSKNPVGKTSGSQKLMQNWLKRASPKKSDGGCEDSGEVKGKQRKLL